MAGFDDIPDPAAVGTSFPGTTTVGSSLAGVPAILTAVTIDTGKKKKVPAGGAAPAGERSVTLGAYEEPDLVSLDKAILEIFNMDDSELSAIQRQMWDGNWFSPTTYKDGYNAGIIQSGDDNENAWNSVVMTSAKTGKPIQEVLQDAIDRVNEQGGIDAVVGKAGAGTQQRPTAKVDLYQYGNAIARELVGREMTRDQMDRFIKQYQGAEAGGEAGAPQNAAAAFLEGENPDEVGAQRMLSAFDRLMGMVGAVKPVDLGVE